jgi:hypothetical protein
LHRQRPSRRSRPSVQQIQSLQQHLLRRLRP